MPVTKIMEQKQSRSTTLANELFLGKTIAPWYPMVENTAGITTIEPKSAARPNASGAYIRVRIGVNKTPKI